MKKRVVVTGMGVVSPLGSSCADLWSSLIAGKSGIGPLGIEGEENLRVRIAGNVSGFNAEDYFSGKEIRKMDPFIQYGVVAADQAIKQAGLDQLEGLKPERIGVSIGSGIGGLWSIEQMGHVAASTGPRRVSANFIPSTIINMISGNVSIKHGLKGPNIATVTACTTGTHNIGIGARLIAYGDADAMVVGGSEYASTILGMAGFGNMKALSGRNEEPTKASRPFDKDRDGFVLSSGAAVLVIESLDHALARGATILCEISGFAMNGDAYHATQPDTSGDGARSVMATAVKDAGIDLADIDYINAHGTSTYYNDLIETTAITDLFKKHTQDLAVSSTKSMHGHMLGAAGAIEAIVCIEAIRSGVIPPTINCDEPNVGLELNLVPHTAQKKPLLYAMSNSFGFGGTNGCLVFKKHDE